MDYSQEESKRELGLVVCSKFMLLINLFSSIKLPLCQIIAVWVSPLSDLCNEWTTKSALDLKADFGKLKILSFNKRYLFIY